MSQPSVDFCLALGENICLVLGQDLSVTSLSKFFFFFSSQHLSGCLLALWEGPLYPREGLTFHMKSPAPGQNPMCDSSGPIIGS